MRSCCDESWLRSFIQCELEEYQCAEIENHLAQCPRCSELLSQLEREAKPVLELAEQGAVSFSGTSLLSQFGDRFTRFMDSEESLELPQIIGFYEIQKVLGKGGMGILYEAEHLMLHRKVAVKFIRHKRFLTPEITERFHQEIISAGRLFHPNIVTTMDAGTFNGQPFLVMELLEGKNLTETIVTNGKLPPIQAVQIILQACRGLKYAHGFGLIHCDLKPSNLWIKPDGSVKVLDLGLTQLRSAMNENVHHGGTPDFMSPEQRNKTEIDEKTDIFSLGCTLFFLLTGKIPNLEDPDFINAAKYGSKIPKKLQKALNQMTDWEKNKRFNSIEEVEKALKPYSSKQSTKKLILLGYALTFLSLVFFPFFTGIAAFILGYVNKRKGSLLHGRIQMWMSPICLLVGAALGAVAFAFSDYYEVQAENQYLKETVKRLIQEIQPLKDNPPDFPAELFPNELSNQPRE
ncbi:MAG: protein kinase [Thermoguttaceae bacterium]|nr:protein kinase [Thermoguttaceae bacterium]